MQGILSCVIALVSFVVMVGFPDSKHIGWHFLNKEEIAFVLARINNDRADAEEKEPFNLKSYMKQGLDLKIWGFALIFCMILVVSYSFAFFLPIILQGKMGFSIAAAQCLVAPPYFAAGLWMVFTGWIGDKYGVRAPILIGNAILALIGLPIMAFTKNVGAQYL